MKKQATKDTIAAMLAISTPEGKDTRDKWKSNVNHVNNVSHANNANNVNSANGVNNVSQKNSINKPFSENDAINVNNVNHATNANNTNSASNVNNVIEKKTSRVSVYLTPSKAEALRMAAWNNHASVNKMVEILIDKYIEDSEK